MSVGTIVLSGCVHPYVVKLSNGMQITTPHKPKLKDGAYQYTDSKGMAVSIPAGRVREIEPASMAEEEKRPLSTPQPHKKRHWYLLWLG